MLKNSKVLKITLVVITILSMLLMLGGNIFASGKDFSQQYIQQGGENNDITRKVGGIGNTVLSIFQAVGTIIAVIMLVWLGIKYIMASPDGKAEIKKQAFAYILGAVLLFGAAWIVPIIAKVISNG